MVAPFNAHIEVPVKKSTFHLPPLYDILYPEKLWVRARASV
jgi:hypothetical protein